MIGSEDDRSRPKCAMTFSPVASLVISFCEPIGMFDRIFDLPRRPFAATPDPACFFAGEAVHAALDELVVCVERGQGIGILTGDPGLGKTLLCQCLIRKLTGRFLPVFLSNSNIANCRSLLQTILCELGEDFSGKDEHELRLSLRQRIQRLPSNQQALVLIVDEAHHFATEVLEEIRLLADIADAGQSLVRVVLSGQMSLEERLTDRAFDALNQRVSAHVTLLPMTLSESRDYVEFRIEWAGGKTESLMSYLAVQLIARASAGVPRCLNQLADHCLLLAVASNKRPVEPETVRMALAELKQLPLQWNDLHELSSFATVDSNAEDAADFEMDTDHEATAADSTDSTATTTTAATPGAASVTAAETSAFEFGGDSNDGASVEIVSSVKALASHSSSDSAHSSAFDVVAVEAVPSNIEASLDPLSTDGVCITISSPHRSRKGPPEAVVEPAASAPSAPLRMVAPTAVRSLVVVTVKVAAPLVNAKVVGITMATEDAPSPVTVKLAAVVVEARPITPPADVRVPLLAIVTEPAPELGRTTRPNARSVPLAIEIGW